MSANKIFIVLAVLFSFIACISAQEKDRRNEVQIGGFLKRENFDKFQFLVSTKENITAMLSKDCADGDCDYDRDWKMRFMYVGEVLGQTININPSRTTYSKPEYRGKLSGIHFSPRKQNFLPDNYVFPADIKCYENAGREFNCWGEGIFIKYNYKKLEDGMITQNKIVYIWVGVTKTESDAITGETVVKDISENKSKP
jgi:hypothetical protein